LRRRRYDSEELLALAVASAADRAGAEVYELDGRRRSGSIVTEAQNRSATILLRRFNHDADRWLAEQATVNAAIARYGGEEFAVIMVGVGGTGAFDIAERIRTRVNTAVTRTSVTVSLGVASFPSHGAELAALIAAADAALYRAKRSGRNRVAVAALAVVEKSRPETSASVLLDR
jgi:predicted signal transduction protein with EAL and GGDEF domain